MADSIEFFPGLINRYSLILWGFLVSLMLEFIFSHIFQSTEILMFKK